MDDKEKSKDVEKKDYWENFIKDYETLNRWQSEYDWWY